MTETHRVMHQDRHGEWRSAAYGTLEECEALVARTGVGRVEVMPTPLDMLRPRDLDYEAAVAPREEDHPS